MDGLAGKPSLPDRLANAGIHAVLPTRSATASPHSRLYR